MTEIDQNFEFYKNGFRNQHKVTLEDILKFDNNAVETTHSFIQWLFPLQLKGAADSHLLTPDEADRMRNDKVVLQNVLRSYKFMLKFYGFELIDESGEDGQLRLTADYEERFLNFVTHAHNALRITRIIKSLGFLGYDHLKLPLVKAFYYHIHGTKKLLCDGCKASASIYLGSLSCLDEREALNQWAIDTLKVSIKVSQKVYTIDINKKQLHPGCGDKNSRTCNSEMVKLIDIGTKIDTDILTKKEGNMLLLIDHIPKSCVKSVAQYKDNQSTYTYREESPDTPITPPETPVKPNTTPVKPNTPPVKPITPVDPNATPVKPNATPEKPNTPGEHPNTPGEHPNTPGETPLKAVGSASTKDNSDSGDDGMMYIVGGSIGALIVILIVVAVLFKLKRKRRQPQSLLTDY
eukprot:GHVR01171469.1.p1 GENE.GHVR01171469.1~~GHVR01171469.1.p1  ORF type:complete len:407 (-),score=85.45 GHVR01171469.1:144-1364(-)